VCCATAGGGWQRDCRRIIRASGNIPDHEAYTSRYQEVTEIDRVQCEIGGADFPFGASERLDLGVFADDLRVTVTGGTQEFVPSDLVAAAEFKYVKTSTTFGIGQMTTLQSITTSPPTSNGWVSFPMMSVVGAWCSPTTTSFGGTRMLPPSKSYTNWPTGLTLTSSSYCRPHAAARN